MRFRTLPLAALLAVLIAACGDDGQLPVAVTENVVDTVTLGSLFHNSDVSLASAYSVSLSSAVRTDLSSNYDFAYDIDPVLGPVLLPAQVTGVYDTVSTNPGLQRSAIPFDSITSAKSNGYIVDQPFTIDSGDVFLARSLIRCSIGVPEYAKLQVLAIDSVAHTMTFQVLADNNCGYRGLEPGLPGS